MSRSGQPPDLKKYMDKKLQIKLNANRMVVGTLRGFDQFMNLVVDNTVEVNGNEKNDIGMVVIRGNSVVTVEALEPCSLPLYALKSKLRASLRSNDREDTSNHRSQKVFLAKTQNFALDMTIHVKENNRVEKSSIPGILY
ncbi:putative small nuclear ribonucleoprotein G [Glycine soja]